MFLNSYHIPLPDTHKSFRKRLSNGQVLGLFSDWPFWLCGIVSHLNIFIALMCWTFCQLWCDDLSYLQSSPTNLWGQIVICTRTDSAEKLEIGAFLLFGFCCLGSLYCPRSKLMIDEFVEGWLKRNGWGHGTRTGTLTCRVTLKVNVFELLPHPAPWHSQVIQKTSIKWTSSWPFLWLTLLIVWNCFAFEYFHCFDVLDFLPTVVWWLVIPSKFSDKFMGTNCDLHQNWLRREAWDCFWYLLPWDCFLAVGSATVHVPYIYTMRTGSDVALKAAKVALAAGISELSGLWQCFMWANLPCPLICVASVLLLRAEKDNSNNLNPVYPFWFSFHDQSEKEWEECLGTRKKTHCWKPSVWIGSNICSTDSLKSSKFLAQQHIMSSWETTIPIPMDRL